MAATGISLCRELSKLHEEILRTTLDGALAHYAQEAPRGEYVLVVAGQEKVQEEALSLEDAVKLVQARLEAGMSKKDAVKLVAADTGFPKNALYEAVMK